MIFCCVYFKDIVEAAERPNLASKSGSYDRFGFFIDTAGSSLEEKAEFLRKQAENHHDQLDEGALKVSLELFFAHEL